MVDWGKIICCSFLWQIWYRESRGQGKFLAKSGDMHLSEVEGAHLKVEGAH